MAESKINDTPMIYLGLVIILCLSLLIYIECLPEEEKAVIIEQLKEESDYKIDYKWGIISVVFFTVFALGVRYTSTDP